MSGNLCITQQAGNKVVLVHVSVWQHQYKITPESDLSTCFLSLLLYGNKPCDSFKLLQKEYYHKSKREEISLKFPAMPQAL